MWQSQGETQMKRLTQLGIALLALVYVSTGLAAPTESNRRKPAVSGGIVDFLFRAPAPNTNLVVKDVDGQIPAGRFSGPMREGRDASLRAAPKNASAPRPLRSWIRPNVQPGGNRAVINVPGDYATIQGAINAAGPGDTINVYPGNYNETAAGSILFDSSGPYQFGLFISATKTGLTIQGVDGGGNPITSAAAVMAHITTNATNNFGTSGTFIEADNVTITGLDFGQNAVETNKTIELLGDNATFRYCQFTDQDVTYGYGGSLYMNDWRVNDNGTPGVFTDDISYVLSYTVEDCDFQNGVTIDIASGTGFSGPAAGRVIQNNTFDGNADVYSCVSFNGYGTCVPWFVYGVGGAVISGNSFTNGSLQYIKARGNYDNTQFDWGSYWSGNSFDKATVALITEIPFAPRDYIYNAGCYPNTRVIGATIQEEVNHAAVGDTVLVHAGLYEEQVVVNKNNLSIKGSGFGSDPSVDSIVKSPVSLPYFFVSPGPNNNRPIIGVHDCTGVVVQNLRVDGAGRGNGNYRFQGIAYWNAGGMIDSCDVSGIRETPLSGNQHGVGIYAYHDSGGPYSLNVFDTSVTDYQKNGMVLAGLNASVVGCTVTGSGPLGLGLPAQNGIQVSSGTSALIMDCEVSDHIYTGGGYAAVGVLVLDSTTSASVLDNFITDNSPGVYLYDTASCTIGNNTISNAINVGYPDAIDIVRDAAYLTSATSGPKSRPQGMDADGHDPSGERAVLSVSIFGNTLMGADVANTAGIYGYSSNGAVSISAVQNKIRDWDFGIVADESGSGAVSGTANNNVIVSNVSAGYFATGPTVQNAENNLWGAATGPADPTGVDEAGSPPCYAPATMKNADGTGDFVSDLYVDYCPWQAGNGFLTLEASDTCIENGQAQITVQLWMRNVVTPVTGFQAFVSFDSTKLTFVNTSGGYSGVPFPLHLRTFVPNTVLTGAGQLSLDGSQNFGGSGVVGDALLATLVFNVVPAAWAQCDSTVLEFFDSPPFFTELSYQGTPIPTCRTESPEIRYDTAAPVISGCTATGGNVDDSCEATVTFSASVSDNCCVDAADVAAVVTLLTGNATLATPSITITQVNGTTVSVSGSVLVSSLTGCPATVQVVVNATDCCGNTATSCTVTADVNDVTPPVITCPPNATIECDESTDPDDVGLLLTMPFDVSPTLSPTQAAGVWYTDRYAPFGFASAVFDGGNRLKHSIDASACSPCRGGGFTGAFYDTQGRKYDLASATSMQIELYVPSAWATTGRRMAGFWGTAFDSLNAISLFPIIEFTSGPDGSGLPRFRGWDNGTWIDMGLPSGFVYDAWYTLKIDLVGSNAVYTVGNLTLSVPSYGSVQIGNVILQGHNNTAGVTYDIYWDNFSASRFTLATDNCSPAPTITYSDIANLAGCGLYTGTIARTWTATDQCGLTASCVQTLTIVDTTPPTITYCPGPVTIQCSTAPTPGNTGGPATASDTCDASPTVTFTDAASLGGCNGTGSITRTWIATDDCGNVSAPCVQVITVVDTTAPTITSCPPNVTIECSDSTVPGIPFGTTSGGLMVYYNPGPEIPANQAYYKAQVSYTNSNGAPFTFSNLPLTGFGPLTWSNLFGQVGPPSQFGFDVELVALTLMGPPPPPMPAYENTNNSVAGRLPAGPVLWKIADYKDGAPNGPSNPANVDINSLFRSPSPGNPLTDVVITQFVVTNPSANIWVAQIAGKLKADNLIHWYNPMTPNSPMATFGLNGDIYFSGTLTYDTTLDTVNGQDFYAGTITFTANSPNATLGFALATDNCTQFPLVTYTDVFTPGGTCPPITGSIARTWKATDACGNMSTCLQTITVVDTTPPAITCPADVTIECGDSTLPANTGLATAVDNCDASVVPTYSDNSAGSCPQVITRTWTATDDCGNSSSCVQTITVQDTSAPTVTPPVNATVECDGAGNLAAFAAWQAGATASDICSGALPATYVQDSDVPGCGGTHVITAHWTAADGCGNVGTSASRTFTIQDTTPPSITCPADITVNADPGGCSASLTITPATGSDTCSGPVTIGGMRDDMAALNAPYPSGVTTITWTATDACGLSTTCDQTVTVNALNSFEIPVLLDGVTLGSPMNRCIRFILKDAGNCNVVTVNTNVLFSGGAPASGLATFTAACSNTGWLEICAKDEQHTLSDKQPLSTSVIPPPIHYTCSPLLLKGGDTDNDNDVDINDVTLLLVQFGSLEASGGCPWNGTRGADFDLNGAIGSPDYTALSANWLQFRNCCNPFGWPIMGPTGPSNEDVAAIALMGSSSSVSSAVAVSQLSPEAAALADLNSDGVVDYRDVEVFETRMGLPNNLSARMRTVSQPSDSSQAVGFVGDE